MAKKKSDVKLMKELSHILGIFTLFIGPLIIYFVREEKEIRSETKKVLNWQFSLLIYFMAASIIEVILFFSLGLLNLQSLLMIVNIILSVIGFVKVSNNEKWEYPLSIKFFK